MLNAPKPVHINVTVTAGVAVGPSATDAQYNYETVADGGIALKVTVPGMTAASSGRRASWIWARNLGIVSGDTVLISFDNGTTFMTLQPAVAPFFVWDTFQARVAFRYFYLRAGANAPTVQCIVGINQT